MWVNLLIRIDPSEFLLFVAVVVLLSPILLLCYAPRNALDVRRPNAFTEEIGVQLFRTLFVSV